MMPGHWEVYSTHHPKQQDKSKHSPELPEPVYCSGASLDFEYKNLATLLGAVDQMRPFRLTGKRCGGTN